MLVQPQCAATVCELLIEEEPWLAGMVSVFPIWLSYDSLHSCVPPASQRCCYCFLQCGTKLSQHFWCFHIKWPFHFSFPDMKARLWRLHHWKVLAQQLACQWCILLFQSFSASILHQLICCAGFISVLFPAPSNTADVAFLCWFPADISSFLAITSVFPSS